MGTGNIYLVYNGSILSPIARTSFPIVRYLPSHHHFLTSSHKSKSAASELLYHSRILWWLCLWILNVWDLLSKVKIRINLTGKLGEDLSSDKTFNLSPHRCAAAGGGWELGSDLQKNATVS